MKNQTTTTTTTRDLYAEADRIVYLAIRARLEKSATPFLFDLANAQTTDRKARDRASMGEDITATEEHLHDLTEERTNLDKLRASAERGAVSIRNNESERAEYRALLREYTKRAEHIRADIDRIRAELRDLYKLLELTSSDREDLVQEACTALLMVERDPAVIPLSVLESYGAESIEDLTESEAEEAQERANFRFCVNWTGRAIGNLASAEALNRTTTTKRKATAEEVGAWYNLYGDIGAHIKISVARKRSRASDCFDTMEYRENKRTGEVGFYRITHYKTIAPYTYIESYTEDENGESDAQYLRSYDPFVQDIGSADIITELEVALDLSDRERAFLAEFRKACRFYDFTEAKAHAWCAVGVTNGATQRKAFERLKAHIVNTISASEALFDQYSYLMR